MEARSGNTARRIALTLQYDGSKFNGWQLQSGGRTVQGEIENAIHILMKDNIRVTASGRTDAGVHALGQVIHFDAVSSISLQRICVSLNGILPHDVGVKNGYIVPADFHARFSAVERHYRYLIYNHPLRTPFIRDRALWVHEKLDVDYLRKVALLLIGEKDFTSFCKKSESKNINTVRRITNIEVNRKDDYVILDILGNAFLHNMVRIIIGTMMEMHNKKADPEMILDIIAKQDRDCSGKTAPAYGLYLVNIIFDPDLSEMESAF
jgi:tRNA pseudouridine38-40 synthase